jgi:hypothetical protein
LEYLYEKCKKHECNELLILNVWIGSQQFMFATEQSELRLHDFFPLFFLSLLFNDANSIETV